MLAIERYRPNSPAFLARTVICAGILFLFAGQVAFSQSTSPTLAAPNVAEITTLAARAFNAKNYADAAKWYRQAAELGDASAQQYLGVLIFNGQGVKQDYDEAFKWIGKAAVQGNVVAQRTIGSIYAAGQGTKQNLPESVKWYRKAADQGDRQAQHDLGMLYSDGRGTPQDFTEAMKWFQKAASQGDAASQNNIGVLYNKGQGVPQDHAEAMRWFLKSADQGWAQGQTDVGLLYYRGEGVAQDYTEALKWFRKAAAQMNSQASLFVGAMYNDGFGVPKDYAMALWWFRQAAAQGETAALALVGNMYALGEGAPQNYPEALKWYRKAADRGDLDAQKLIPGLEAEAVKSVNADRLAELGLIAEQSAARYKAAVHSNTASFAEKHDEGQQFLRDSKAYETLFFEILNASKDPLEIVRMATTDQNSSITLEDGFLKVFFAFKTLDDYKMYSAAIVERVSRRRPDIGLIEIHATTMLKDARGKEYSGDGVVSTFSKHNADRVNWSDMLFVDDKYFQLADSFWVHPSIGK